MVINSKTIIINLEYISSYSETSKINIPFNVDKIIIRNLILHNDARSIPDVQTPVVGVRSTLLANHTLFAYSALLENLQLNMNNEFYLNHESINGVFAFDLYNVYSNVVAITSDITTFISNISFTLEFQQLKN